MFVEKIKVPKDGKYIMAQPDAGLGNRLKCIYSGLYYADLYNVPLDLLWLREPCCNVEYSDLFEESENIRVHTIFRLGYKNKYAFKSIATDRLLEKIKKKLKYFDAGMTSGFYKANGEPGIKTEIEENHAVCFMSSGQNCADEHFLLQLGKIRPAREILNRVDEIMSPYKDCRTVGIHIRRTDHTEAIANSSLESFIEIMKRESEIEDTEKSADTKVWFYLATDDSEVEKSLFEMFSCIPHICFSSEKSRSTSAGMKDAYVDMLCLSKCEKIYGSFESTFSQMAALIGNAPLIIAKS